MPELIDILVWGTAGAGVLGGLKLWARARRKGVRHKGGIPIGPRQRKEQRDREWREKLNRRRRKR